MIRFETATVRHAQLIAECMRPRDAEEVRAGWGMEPGEAIRVALESSYYARACFWGLQPLGVYGLSALSILGGASQIWIFGTRHIDEHGFAFSRASRLALLEIYQRASVITNFVDVDDELALRWLEWLGGTCVLPNHNRGGKVFGQFILENRCRQG